MLARRFLDGTRPIKLLCTTAADAVRLLAVLSLRRKHIRIVLYRLDLLDRVRRGSLHVAIEIAISEGED